MMPTKLPFVSLLLFLIGTLAAEQTHYELHPNWDQPLLGFGLIGSGFAFLKEQEIAGHSIDPNQYSRKDIPTFDRWAIGYYSKSLSTLSDVLIVMEGLAPVFQTGLDFQNQEESLSEAWRDAVLYGEVVAYASALSLYSKTLLLHPRPLVFTDKAPQSERTSGDSRNGFFSEHTTGAFAAAVFTGYTFELKHPNSHWIPWVWTGTLGTATAVGVLRVASGKHFPSDVLAGAVVGSLVGYGIPRMHVCSRPDSQGHLLNSKAASLLSRMDFNFEPAPDGKSAMFMIRIHG